MKALVVSAEWSPRKGYRPAKEEIESKKAFIGSRVWKNPNFEIKELPTPDPGDDEVLVRVKTCGICGSDTHVYETDEEGYIIFSGMAKFPCIPGHEFSGVVEKVGARVVDLKKGDMVAMESVMWCGLCSACRGGSPNQCENLELMGLSADGAFAEYVAVNQRYCWKINDIAQTCSREEAFNVGALIEPVGCAYNGIFIVGGGLKPGSTTVVYGTGPIGLGAVALAGIAGSSKVIAFDVIDERVKLAIEMGADHAFNANGMSGVSLSEKVMELTKNRGADIQIEAAGAASRTIPEMEKTMSRQGQIIYLGRADTSSPMFLDVLVSGANKIIGSRGHAGYGIFPNIISLVVAGKLDLMKMATSQYPFSKIMEAMEVSTKRKDGKILVKIND